MDTSSIRGQNSEGFMTDLNERVAVLETLLQSQDTRHKEMEVKVNAMYDVIMQLRGAKWVGWFVAAALGFLISNISGLMNFFQGK